MIMALRYGGLGFEMNSAEDELKNELDNDNYKAITKVDFLDVIHYGFSYMGVLTGINFILLIQILKILIFLNI